MDFYNLSLGQHEHTKLIGHNDVASTDSEDHSESIALSTKIESASTSSQMPLQTHEADTPANPPHPVPKVIMGKLV